jgi:hypothetical protein
MRDQIIEKRGFNWCADGKDIAASLTVKLLESRTKVVDVISRSNLS